MTDRTNPAAIIDAVRTERALLPEEGHATSLPAPETIGLSSTPTIWSDEWDGELDPVLVNNQPADPIPPTLNPSATLPQMMADAVYRLAFAMRGFIEQHYSDTSQRTLTFMHSETFDNEYVLRRAHIESACQWVQWSIGAYYAARAAVLASTTNEAVMAVAIDFDALAAADPLVTIETAAAITL